MRVVVYQKPAKKVAKKVAKYLWIAPVALGVALVFKTCKKSIK